MTTKEALLKFDNSYARLGERFSVAMAPVPVSQPVLVKLNHDLAGLLGLDLRTLASREWVDVLAGNRVPLDAAPLAMAYAGHQFGNFVPKLGDGRAILIGEVICQDGVRRDIQLKGAGRTPFSRMGDGRAALGPVLREYIVSEAMTALSVPSTRSLAVVTTGDVVLREQALPGAVLTRIAESHVRIGTFQYFAARSDVAALQALADYVIQRHYPEASGADNPYRALLDCVIARQANLVAKWLGIGFIHGVMNTDNMSISGETIDYGPCAFMDTFHPDTVYSSIDTHGRYAYSRQPQIAHWNLMCLAQALLPLLGEDEATSLAEGQAAIDGFAAAFETAWLGVMRAKVGLREAEPEDRNLIENLLQVMAEGKADFTLTFRGLSGLSAQASQTGEPVMHPFDNPVAFGQWSARWRARLEREASDDLTRQAAMRSVNPAYIPRNHRVEAAIESAYEGDFAPFERLVDVLSKPYQEVEKAADYAAPPRPQEVVKMTFCGT